MSCVVSAPGKVLITGAYLVLDRPNSGLVLSVSARFFAIVKPFHVDLPDDSWSWSWADVKVNSPQLDSQSSYKLSLRDYTLCTGGKSHGFVEDAIQYAIAASIALDDGSRANEIKKKLLHGITVTVLGSNDFYSFRKQIEEKGLPLTAASLASLEPFRAISFNKSTDSNVPDIAKTGLGSSAAMTTAIVGSILEYLGTVKLPYRETAIADVTASSLDVVHAVSQTAHCHSQGKIGSGFDVSAAVYGSQRYIRFSPAIVTPAMVAPKEYGKLVKAIKSVLEIEKWDCVRSSFELPSGFELVLGEPGNGGSHTPSMVGAVKEWSKRDPKTACIVWEELAEANKKVEEKLLFLKQWRQQDENDYISGTDACRTKEWNDLKGETESSTTVRTLLEIREAFTRIRSLLRKIGDAANVPIEPESQRRLVDESMGMRGVLFGGVPGAGGNDAVFAVTIGKIAREMVEKLWREKGVLTLTVEEDSKGVCVENRDPTHV